VPEHSSVDLSCEFNNVKDWAAKNKMIINFQITKEFVFHRLNPRNIVYPSFVETLNRLSGKVTGLFIQANFLL